MSDVKNFSPPAQRASDLFQYRSTTHQISIFHHTSYHPIDLAEKLKFKRSVWHSVHIVRYFAVLSVSPTLTHSLNGLFPSHTPVATFFTLSRQMALK